MVDPVVVTGIIAIMIAAIGALVNLWTLKASQRHNIGILKHQYDMQQSIDMDTKRNNALFDYLTYFKIGLQTHDRYLTNFQRFNEHGGLTPERIEGMMMQYNEAHRISHSPLEYGRMNFEFDFYWRKHRPDLYAQVKKFVDEFTAIQKPIISFFFEMKDFNEHNVPDYITKIKSFNVDISAMQLKYDELVDRVSEGIAVV